MKKPPNGIWRQIKLAMLMDSAVGKKKHESLPGYNILVPIVWVNVLSNTFIAMKNSCSGPDICIFVRFWKNVIPSETFKGRPSYC
ncbi:11850_t:CDS:2 [Dentiscutata erythropus]|uniref:11850_t:CDS:1 n=1 Tax=Dentiscutata erythropus TaxID=1348616 RepID=A0A9N9NEV3_9GLOM|nr:11850_t:CDS:2 [Dentiscutata erythropus]